MNNRSRTIIILHTYIQAGAKLAADNFWETFLEIPFVLSSLSKHAGQLAAI